MEEDDDQEIQSQPSPDAKSPASPPPNVTTTATAAATPQPQNNHQLRAAVEKWYNGATSVLIDAWAQRHLQQKKGKLKQPLWEEIAQIVSTHTPKTHIQCKNRMDTLKKIYKAEKSSVAAAAAGGGPSHWPFFRKLDELIGDMGPTGEVTSGVRKSVRLEEQRQQLLESGSESESRWSESTESISPVKRARIRKESNRNRNVRFGGGNQGRERNSLLESSDGLPPVNRARNRRESNWNWNRNQGGKFTGGNQGRETNWGSCEGEVIRAIENFGEVYERVENSKVERLVEFEKQRMEFTKDLELKRIQFFMDFQLEFARSNHSRRIENRNQQQQNGEEEEEK